jgi:phosphate-selective porin
VGNINTSLFIPISLSLSYLALSIFTPGAFGADFVPPVLITGLYPWSGGEVSPVKVNVLLSDGYISAVSETPIDVDANTIVLDGGGRVVMGKIVIGEPANLLVVEGNPAEDITVLASPAAHFIVVRNGVILDSAPMQVAGAAAAESSKYKVLDPSRFKVVTLPRKPWYAYTNDHFSVAFGGGVLLDRTEYRQGNSSREQFGSLNEFNTGEVRAVRLGVGGGFRVSDKLWKYTLVGANRAFDQGFDTDDDEEWTWYDWALGIPVYGGAELKIGKQKENFSHDRLTVLVDQPFMERAAELDTLLPSRNTGITLANNALNGRVTWSLGYFTNMLDDRDEPFEDSDQYIARVTALPILSDDGETIIHAGAGYRYSNVNSRTMHFRGKPGVFFGPYFIDTGAFSAERAAWHSLEAGWMQGPFWLMGEYVPYRCIKKTH